MDMHIPTGKHRSSPRGPWALENLKSYWPESMSQASLPFQERWAAFGLKMKEGGVVVDVLMDLEYVELIADNVELVLDLAQAEFPRTGEETLVSRPGT